MLKYCCLILVVGLLMLARHSPLWAQSASAGAGLFDVLFLPSQIPSTPCTTFVTDYSDACNLIVTVTAGIAR